MKEVGVPVEKRSSLPHISTANPLSTSTGLTYRRLEQWRHLAICHTDDPRLLQDACIVVDWSNIISGLRQALLAKSQLGCACKSRYYERLGSLDTTLGDILLLFEWQVKLYVECRPAHSTLIFQKKWAVGNERLSLNDRKENLKVSILSFDLGPDVTDSCCLHLEVGLLRAMAKGCSNRPRKKRVIKLNCSASLRRLIIRLRIRQGVDESCLNHCRDFILDSKRYKKSSNDRVLLVYLSADMNETPCDPKGFPGYVGRFLLQY